jgi:hypothetical protein
MCIAVCDWGGAFPAYGMHRPRLAVLYQVRSSGGEVPDVSVESLCVSRGRWVGVALTC